MSRLVLLISLLIISCQPAMPPIASTLVKQETLPTKTGFPEPTQFSGWASVTQQRIFVGHAAWHSCIGPTPEQREADEKRYGLHLHHEIMVRVNATGIQSFRNGKVMPVGSIIAKEKYIGSNPMSSYALMIKREAGYDPEHGDWQYVYVDSNAKPAVSEGKLVNCIKCHDGAKDSDYLFKFYMQRAYGYSVDSLHD